MKSWDMTWNPRIIKALTEMPTPVGWSPGLLLLGLLMFLGG